MRLTLLVSTNVKLANSICSSTDSTIDNWQNVQSATAEKGQWDDNWCHDKGHAPTFPNTLGFNSLSLDELI